MRAGHGQHGLHALLHAGQAQGDAGRRRLPVQVHEAADGGRVHVGDLGQVDQHLLAAAGDEGHDRSREVGQQGVHDPRLADADDRQARLVAVLDNLGKGASGAAVQVINLKTGVPETTGLAVAA